MTLALHWTQTGHRRRTFLMSWSWSGICFWIMIFIHSTHNPLVADTHEHMLADRYTFLKVSMVNLWLEKWSISQECENMHYNSLTSPGCPHFKSKKSRQSFLQVNKWQSQKRHFLSTCLQSFSLNPQTWYSELQKLLTLSSTLPLVLKHAHCKKCYYVAVWLKLI